MRHFECRAILFDLDGVLVDSTGQIEEQWRRWAVSRGLPPEPFLKVCHGRRALETIRLAAPHLDAEAEIAAFQPDDHDQPRLSLRPLDGAADLLAQLPVGTWAVATSGPRLAARERLESAGLPLPGALIGAEDVEHGKPHPDVYLLAADRLGAEPTDCVVVEDAPAGIASARAAGMRVIALTTTHSAEQLPADFWLSSLAEVKLIKGQAGTGGALYLELWVPDG